MKKSILAILLIALSLSCFAIGKKKLHAKMNSWLRHSKHELVMKWGMPTRTGDDGNGGEIVLYAYSGSREAIPLLQGDYIPAQSWYDYRIFYINSDGIIYSWRTTRERIPPQQINLYIYRN